MDHPLENASRALAAAERRELASHRQNYDRLVMTGQLRPLTDAEGDRLLEAIRGLRLDKVRLRIDAEKLCGFLKAQAEMVALAGARQQEADARKALETILRKMQANAPAEEFSMPAVPVRRYEPDRRAAVLVLAEAERSVRRLKELEKIIAGDGAWVKPFLAFEAEIRGEAQAVLA